MTIVQGIFLDLESNGLDCYRHRVMQIALKLVRLDTGHSSLSYESTLFLSTEEWKESDLYSLNINGLTDYALHAHSPTREQVGEKIADLLNLHGVNRSNSIFICQNPSFDRPFFAQLINPYLQEQYGWPYHWLDLASMFWAKEVARPGVAPPKGLSKDAIAKHFGLAPEEKPHKAMGGVEHLVGCYEALVGWPLAFVQGALLSSGTAMPRSRPDKVEPS